jgi:hypothetical protein
MAKLNNIVMLWDGGTRSDLTQSQWEGGVVSTLRDLYVSPPCETSRAIIDAIQRTSKKVTIIPERQPLMPDKSDANAHADAQDSLKATIRGGKPEAPPSPSDVGIGGGSDVMLSFAAQDWAPSSSDSLNAVDETLLHELVHAVRQTLGVEDSSPLSAPFAVLRKGDGTVSQLMTQSTAYKPTKHSQIYNDREEFAAIMITNIYRSEVGRPGLRRDHLGGNALLTYPLTNPQNFLSVWRPQIVRICGEMGRALCDKLASVDCSFNPIFELYAAQNKFAPGKRLVRA